MLINHRDSRIDLETASVFAEIREAFNCIPHLPESVQEAVKNGRGEYPK